MRGRSGLQALDGPAIALSHVFKTVVKPAWPSLPEFDSLRNHPVTAPETGQGNFAGAELAFHLRHFLFQQAPGSNRLALLRYPGANLAAPWPGGEVFQGFRLADLFHRPLNTYLTVQADPGKQQRCLGVLLQFQRLAAAVVGVEHEAPVIEVFQQHGTQVRHLVGTGGGQRHALGSRIPAVRASSNQAWNCKTGSSFRCSRSSPSLSKSRRISPMSILLSPLGCTGSVTSCEDIGFSAGCQVWLTKTGARRYA